MEKCPISRGIDAFPGKEHSKEIHLHLPQCCGASISLVEGLFSIEMQKINLFGKLSANPTILRQRLEGAKARKHIMIYSFKYIIHPGLSHSPRSSSSLLHGPNNQQEGRL